MVNEVTSLVFGNTVILREGTPLQTGHRTISVIQENGTAASTVFTYDPVSQVMDTDQEKLADIILYFSSKHGTFLSAIISISDLIVGVVNGLVRFISAILGSFVGFGTTGIFIVLLLAILSFAISLYAFVAVAPFLIISYGLRFYKNNLIRDEVENLTSVALNLFNPSTQIYQTANPNREKLRAIEISEDGSEIRDYLGHKIITKDGSHYVEGKRYMTLGKAKAAIKSMPRH